MDQGPEVAKAAQELRQASPEEILVWSARHAPRVGCTLSFGGTGIILAHMIGTLHLPIPIYFLDTGLLFPETLAYREEFARRYGLTVVDVRPRLSVAEQEERYGPALYRRDPDRCCALRKVEPMQRVLSHLDCWITGLRRDQAPTREAVEVAEEHLLPDGRSILKVNPLAFWTRRDCQAYMERHGLPQNPLLAQGYKSLGCWPCTAKVAAGEPERAGRWPGTGKTECGLHTFTARRQSQEG